MEQWGAISGFGNRSMTVVSGPDRTMLVDDTATDWGEGGPDDHRAIQAWRDPLVTAVAPAPASSGPAPEVITVEFSILVSPVGGDASQVIEVADGEGDTVVGTVEQTGGRTFAFIPAEVLDAGDYRVTVAQVEQSAPMVKPFAWTFTVQ